MGLDITAYSKLEYVGRHEMPEGVEKYLCEVEDETPLDRLHVNAFSYNSFPHALAGLPDGAVRQEKVFGSDNFLLAGCFAVTDETKTMWLAAGSYAGYGRFRDMLKSCFADDTRSIREQPDAPFFELVWFADNEGTLLTQACTELLEDFTIGRAKWVGFIEETVPSLQGSAYYVRKYDAWIDALEIAADGGLLDFH
jgi:hypothetical protein